MPSLAHYMGQYDREHESVWNKNPSWPWNPDDLRRDHSSHPYEMALGAGFLLADGCSCCSATGSKGTIRRFFQVPIYLLVGPVWVANEVWEFLTGMHRKPTSEGTTESQAAKQ